MNDPRKGVVESGYDLMAEQYLATKDPQDPLALSALEEMARDLKPDDPVLDLGCGAGVPATLWLAEKGFSVTGVDVSERQLALARRHVPGGTFLKADMTGLEFEPGSFAAVVALHSIIHVPREEHPTLLEKIHHWLRPGGLFLATLTMTEVDGEDPDWEGWGAAMRWSHYDAETNRRMLKEAGFGILHADPRTGAGETWLWTLARAGPG